MKNTFKKSDLRTGMIVKIRDGRFCLVMLDSGKKETKNYLLIFEEDGWLNLDSYLDNLVKPDERGDFDGGYDIIEVYHPKLYHIKPSTENIGEMIWKEKSFLTLDGVEYSESTLRSLIKKATSDLK